MRLRWRRPRPAIVTRWRGPGGAAVLAGEGGPGPVAAVIGPPGPPGPVGPPGELAVIDGGTFN
jgi:hypothetical protein